MEITPYIDVRHYADQLGLDLPLSVVVLPFNLEEAEAVGDLTYWGSAPDVTKLLRQQNIPVSPLTAEPLTTRRDHDHTLVLPALFFASSFLSENGAIISVALGVLANYATQMLQGVTGSPNVRLTVAVETNKTTKTTTTVSVKRIDYDGPPSGLVEVAKIAETIHVEP